MAEEAVEEAAEVGVVFHVVGQGWDQSATAEATEVEARVPTTRAGRVPCLTAAATPRVVVPNVRETGRTATLSVRKPVVIAEKIILVKGRSGAKITMVTT